MEPSESITSPQELDGTVNKFTEACNTTVNVACPTGKEKPPWWTQQLSILRTNCRCLFNRAKAGNTDTNWLNSKYELGSYKKAIRRAKRNAWQTFCNNSVARNKGGFHSQGREGHFPSFLKSFRLKSLPRDPRKQR